MAENLSKLGASVFIVGRRQSMLESASKEIMSKYGNQVCESNMDRGQSIGCSGSVHLSTLKGCLFQMRRT
jgi:short-subunit dehydrogenase